MNKYRYKVGDCVIYTEKNGYWKVFKILEVEGRAYKYKCLDSGITNRAGKVGFFTRSSLVGTKGIVVDESDYMSYIVAKGL